MKVNRMRIRLRMTLGNAHQWRLQKLDALGANEKLDFWGAYDGLCGEGGKTRVDLKYRYSLKV